MLGRRLTFFRRDLIEIGLLDALGRCSFVCRGLAGIGNPLRFKTFFQVSQYGQASLCIVEHVPGLTATRLHRFHVVLDADYRVGNPVGFLLGQARWAAAGKRQHQQLANFLDHIHGPGLVEHQETRLDTANQTRNGVDALRVTLGGDALAVGLLDSREIDDALAHDGFSNLFVVRVFVRTKRRFRIGFLQGLRRHDQTNQLLIEPILYLQQRRRDFEDRLFVDRSAT